MPRLETAKRISASKYNGAKTIGEIFKEESDWAIEETWGNDIQSKVCYIYDYFHDDQPHLNSGMTYSNTTKTKIDAKFIIKSYQSLDKDQVEYYVQFRPSQKVEFNMGDSLYYFETDYRRKYGVMDFPIGMYLDLPDDNKIYHKWIICEKEIANQFVKYLVIPCDYYLTWVERDGTNKYKRGMWCAQRQQNSYSIGTYRDRYFAHPDNQKKIWVPLNSITEKMWYNDDENKTMRLIVSAKTEKPLVWSVTKIENYDPIGIQKLTLYQNFFNPRKDYIEHDENGYIVAMYADYYDSDDESISPVKISEPHSTYAQIVASTSTVKVGGSYKLLTLKIYDQDNNEITEQYNTSKVNWTCFVNSDDLTNKVTWLDGKQFNQKKIKFPDTRIYLGKVLTIKCSVGSLEASMDFNLSI